jgi:hypothetical protein
MAAADNLGRVLLVDAASATVLRVFKGYRDAHCAWLSLQFPAIQPSTSSALASAAGARPADHEGVLMSSQPVDNSSNAAVEGVSRLAATTVASGTQELQGSQVSVAAIYGPGSERLYLAVCAPRRSVIEVWEVPQGARICSLKIGPDCCMIALSPVFGHAELFHMNSRVKKSTKPLSSCWVLNCAQGWLWSLEDAVRARLSM